MLTALIDYESGNLHSALKAFEKMAAELDAGDVVVTSDPDVVARFLRPRGGLCGTIASVGAYAVGGRMYGRSGRQWWV